MDATWREHLTQDGPGRMRIKRHGRMLADAVLISAPEMLREGVDDRSPQQLVNTAELPGIVGDAWAMADWHFGYGFPIGGVVATSVEHGEAGGPFPQVALASTSIAVSDCSPRGWPLTPSMFAGLWTACRDPFRQEQPQRGASNLAPPN